MQRRFTRGGAILALIAFAALIAFGGYKLWDSHWGDERPVTLLSKRVTLGPEPLVIQAPRGTSASGTSFLLTVYLARQKVCEGSEWSKEEAKRLPAIYASAVTSDGEQHAMAPDDCCVASRCGALTLYYRTDSQGGRRLISVELSAPEPVSIQKVTWASWESEIGHLDR